MLIDRLARSGVIAVIAALFSACGTERQIAAAEQNACVSCHGGLDNQTGAPPYATNGEATGPAVGAHTVHVDAGVACESCHVVPAGIGQGHPTGGRAVITFGGLAVAGSTADRLRTGPPQYDPATYTCSAVYCHGGTLDAGGTNTAPSWGQVLPSCGTCHDFPPPSHSIYPSRFLCSGCHGASVEDDNFTLKQAHLNGTLNFN